MDIIELLIQQHDSLRAHLVQIRKHLTHNDLNDLLGVFVNEFELHESVEEQFLYPEVSGLFNQETHGENTYNFEEMHTLIWKNMKLLVQAVSGGHREAIQEAFFKFDALLEAHMSAEDRTLFPLTRKSVSFPVLQELGEKAAKYAEQFKSSSRAGIWNGKIN